MVVDIAALMASTKPSDQISAPQNPFVQSCLVPSQARSLKATIRNHEVSNSTKTKNRSKKWRKRSSSGNLPDVFWGHIPLEDLREHPRFVPLPETLHHLETKEDVRNFRQESWQWDVLHEGRMTTSQTAAALGFLEPLAGAALGVPKGLRKGGQGAYYRLKKPVAVRSLEEMNEILCIQEDTETNTRKTTKNPWSTSRGSNNYPFAAKYTVDITREEVKRRKELSQKRFQKSHWSIRMVWGNVQEATALLTALNYFWKQDKRVVMKEIGMCGAGLQISDKSIHTNETQTGLLLGATPDAVLCHPDGRIEAVEVKNHCPFVPNSSRYNRRRETNVTTATYRLSQRGIKPTENGEKSVFLCQYLPQLMMEILCLGDQCESAILVRQTATNGALIVRVHRDQVWIDEMIFWLNRFYNEYVQNEEPPPENFFFENDNQEEAMRYQRFLEYTKEVIKTKVTVLDHVPHRSIQRSMAKHPVSSDLFLD